MKNCITKSEVIEKQVVYSKDLKDRYELTVKVQGKKGKSILMLCMNPATENVLVSDTTTNYLMNNLFVMGYTTITICNLFSKICSKLSVNAIKSGSDDNMEYLRSVLERDFQVVLVGYGNTFTTNKEVVKCKDEFDKLLLESGKKAVELVDNQELYSRLHTIHPLFAGHTVEVK